MGLLRDKGQDRDRRLQAQRPDHLFAAFEVLEGKVIDRCMQRLWHQGSQSPSSAPPIQASPPPIVGMCCQSTR